MGNLLNNQSWKLGGARWHRICLEKSRNSSKLFAWKWELRPWPQTEGFRCSGRMMTFRGRPVFITWLSWEAKGVSYAEMYSHSIQLFFFCNKTDGLRKKKVVGSQSQAILFLLPRSAIESLLCTRSKYNVCSSQKKNVHNFFSSSVQKFGIHLKIRIFEKCFSAQLTLQIFAFFARFPRCTLSEYLSWKFCHSLEVVPFCGRFHSQLNRCGLAKRCPERPRHRKRRTTP